ncbi:hypothetical protein H5410_014719 [Solanum commersonii]|uniref:Uncharacterized protein n=1 Tax=Solanum commersonii TaxID=4109 RepID=A0A9J5ZSA4_SOLCO|nr:hypothetical protein H5410_014719 [Solanum commersonii]
MCLYSRTCIFGSNDAYSSKLESAQPKQELKVGHDGRGYVGIASGAAKGVQENQGSRRPLRVRASSKRRRPSA